MTPIKVAITDDEKLFRKGISLIVQSSNMEVLFEAEDGEDLIKELEHAKILPEVILLDMKMKRLNGMETTKIIREKYPEIGIIILSTYFTSTFVKYMIELGVNSYLPKNAEPEDVVNTIKKVKENGYHFSNEMLKMIRENNTENKGQKNPTFSITDEITQRELEVLELICKQYTSLEIADRLNCSHRTVEGHRKNLIQKTGVRNVAGLVVYALTQELIDLSNYKISEELK